MKKQTRIIIFLVFLLALFGGWIVFRNKLENKMREALSARYPADTFTVRDVTLTVIPPGAKATARAEHEGLDFDVRLFRDIGKETEVKDNYYEARSLKHYADVIKPRMERHKDQIEGYALEMINIGEKSRDPETGCYPASVEIMLNRSIRDVDTFLEEVVKIADDFRAEPIKGVDAYTFMTLPGSVPQSDLPALGLNAAWLTQPSPTPTPSPTPRPLASGVTTASLAVTETTAGKTDESTSEHISDRKPAFAYELTILSDRFDLDLPLLRNSCRSITYSRKELKRLAERLNLSDEARELMDRASERQLETQTAQKETGAAD